MRTLWRGLLLRNILPVFVTFLTLSAFSQIRVYDLPNGGHSGTYWKVWPNNGRVLLFPLPTFYPRDPDVIPVYEVDGSRNVFLFDGEGATNEDLGAAYDYLIEKLNTYSYSRNFETETSEGESESFAPQAYSYGTNDLWVKIISAELTALTNVSASLTVHSPVPGTFDIFFRTNIAPSNSWFWIARGLPNQTNFYIAGLPADGAGFFRAGTTNGLDMDTNGVTTAYRILVGGDETLTNDFDHDSLPDAWEIGFFGDLSQEAAGDFNLDGQNNHDAYTSGKDPNKVQFLLIFPSNHVSSTTVFGHLTLLGGIPSYVAVLVNDTNLANASWELFTSTNVPVNLSGGDGKYSVQIGLRGRPDAAAATWLGTEMVLDTVPPTVVVTNPGSLVVSQPLLQLQGWANEPLSRVSYDITNAAGLLTNQTGYVTGQLVDTNLIEFTTNFYQCYDVPLTEGTNRITLRATDLAGNITASNLVVRLDYSTESNSPAVTLLWPPDGTQIAGDSFTVQARVDNSTATVEVSVVDGSGNTNGVQALVERSGLLWAKNLPLGGGSNMVFVTARSAAGHVSTVSASVIRSSFTVTLNPLGTNQVNKSLVSVTGMVSAASAQVWVNEVEATVELDGTWRANDVPVNAAATAIFDVQIYATPPPGTSARPSSEADGSQVFEQAQPPRVVLVGYSGRVRFSGFSEACTPPSLNWQRDEQIAWSREAGGLLHDLETSDSFENPPSEDTRVLSPGEGAISSPWEQSAASIAVSGLQTCHRRRTSMDYRVETRLAIEPGGQQRIGETVVYLVRGRALEVAPPDAFADPPIFGNLVGGENRTGTIPVAPQAQQVNDMALMSTGETNADGSVWGWTLAQAAAGAPLKLKHAVTQVQQYNDHTLDLKVSVPTLRMFANGKDLSTNTPEFCVGQKITFTTNWSSMPAGVQSRTVHWTLDGNYVNDFDQFSFNTSTNYFVNTSLLTNETTSAWWVSGATNPIIYTARLAENLTLTNGAQAIVTAKGQFKMFRPSVVMLNPAVNGTPSNIWITPWNILHFGKVGLGLSGGPNNLSFEVQVLSPHFEGDAKITQICTLEGSGISAVTNVLDNENPYTNAFTHVLTNSINPFNGHTNNIIRVDDAPQNASVESFHLYASFVDYIMFAPMGSTNISVPLGNLSWSTSFGASHPSTNISPNIVSPPTNPNASEAWPTWSDVFSNPN